MDSRKHHGERAVPSWELRDKKIYDFNEQIHQNWPDVLAEPVTQLRNRLWARCGTNSESQRRGTQRRLKQNSTVFGTKS